MKKSLLKIRLLTNVVMIVCVLLLASTTGFAATKTWAGGTGTIKSWTLGANWSGGTAPVAGDDIVFNTPGIITFTTMPSGTISYNSLTIDGGSIVTVSGSSALTITLGGNPNVDFVIAGGGSAFVLGTNINITMAPNASANISGGFTINAGRTYNTDGALVVTSVFGTITNMGTITCASSNKLLFQDGCAYIHSQNGGTIPTAMWDINSFCNITGLTTTHPAGADQTFGNLTYDCPGMSADLTMANGVSVTNSFAVLHTGTARLLMTAGSFTIGGDFNLEANFTIANTTNRTLNVVGNVFLSGLGNLDLCSGGPGNIGTLNISGNLTNFGAITETGTGTGVINFNSNLPQNINQSGVLVNSINFGFDNSSVTGVTFLSSATFYGTLTLTNGLINISAGSTLTIASGSAIDGSGFGPTKHINTQVLGSTQGFLRVDNLAASTAYTFPTGNGTYYLPVTLTPPNTSSFSVGVFQGITENGLPNGTAFTAAKKQGVVDAVWTVNRNSGTLGTNMTLAWPAALEGSSFSGYTTPQIGIGHWDGPQWGLCAGTGNNSANTATRNGITSFSPFSVGKTPYLLPVKFSYLNASKGNGYNTLYWKAGCSSSEADFEVLRSSDGRNFTTINSITASQLRCAQPFTYVDNTGFAGTVFYRIKSTEISGLVTYSTIVKLTDQQSDMRLAGVLPNPVVNQAQLKINSVRKDEVELAVITLAGKIVYRNNVQLQPGASVISLDIANLPAGIYMIRGVFSDGQINTIRFTKR